MDKGQIGAHLWEAAALLLTFAAALGAVFLNTPPEHSPATIAGPWLLGTAAVFTLVGAVFRVLDGNPAEPTKGRLFWLSAVTVALVVGTFAGWLIHDLRPTGPVVAIDSIEWTSPNGMFQADVDVEDLDENSRQAVWSFSQRVGGSQIYYAQTQCEVDDGEAICEGKAGDDDDYGAAFNIIVAILSEEQSDALIEEHKKPGDVTYAKIRDIPRAVGDGTLVIQADARPPGPASP